MTNSLFTFVKVTDDEFGRHAYDVFIPIGEHDRMASTTKIGRVERVETTTGTHDSHGRRLRIRRSTKPGVAWRTVGDRNSWPQPTRNKAAERLLRDWTDTQRKGSTP